MQLESCCLACTEAAPTLSPGSSHCPGFSQALIITSICLVQLCSSLTHLLSSGPSGLSLCSSLAYWSPLQGAQWHFEVEVTSHSPSLIPWVQPFQLCSVPARCSWGYCCHQESSSSATTKTLGPAAFKNPRWPNQHKGTPLLTSPSPKACRPLLSLGGHGSEGILFSPSHPLFFQPTSHANPGMGIRHRGGCGIKAFIHNSLKPLALGGDRFALGLNCRRERKADPQSNAG